MQDLNLLDDIVQYQKLFTDVAFWKPFVNLAMSQVDLPCDQVQRGVPGTFPTFLVDNRYVIKFFGRLFDGAKAYQVELFANRLVAEQEIPVPKLMAQGLLRNGSVDWRWPFLVFEHLKGYSIGEVWSELSVEAKEQVAKEMGQMVGSLHSIPLQPDGFFLPAWDQFQEFLEIQRSNCVIRLEEAGSLPDHLLCQVESFLLPVYALVDCDQNPHLIHADLTRDHLLGEVVEGKWKTEGLIDFGDAMVGNILYELVALFSDLFQCDRSLLKIFLMNYPLRQILGSDFAVRSMNMMFLHLFGAQIMADLFWKNPEFNEVSTLFELTELVWGSGYDQEAYN